jgi:DNA repair protein RadC
LSYCSIHPREVFKAAVVANAASIIMIHNHPSGNPHPSSDDLALTARLKEAGDILGIPVVDHIVLGDENYYSFKEAGNL